MQYVQNAISKLSVVQSEITEKSNFVDFDLMSKDPENIITEELRFGATLLKFTCRLVLSVLGSMKKVETSETGESKYENWQTLISRVIFFFLSFLI